MGKGYLNDYHDVEDWYASLSYDSVNDVDGVAKDYPQGDNKPQISQSLKRFIDPSLRRFVPDASSQTNNHSNVMHHYPHEEYGQSFLFRWHFTKKGIQTNESTDCNFSTKDSAYIDGVFRDYPQNDNVMCHYPHKGDHQSLLHRPNSGYLSQHAPFNPNSVIGNVAVTPLESNFKKPMFGPNQGAVSLKSPGMLDGSKTNAEVNTKPFRVNVVGNSKRGTIPPLNANHSIMDSRRLQDPSFDINNAISGSQNNNNNNNPMHVLPPSINQIMHSTQDEIHRRIRKAQESLAYGFNQTMQHEHDVLTSPGKGSKRPFSRHYSDYAASLRPSSSPMGMATGGMDPSIPHHSKATLPSLARFKSLATFSPHQFQVTMSIPQPCSLTQTISPTQIPQMTPQMSPSVPKSHSKRRRTKASKPTGEAMFKSSGIRCCLCNLDLSYDPEIEGLTLPPPAYCILRCGHAFHQICLSSKCIACTAQCCRGQKNMGRDRKLN